MHKKGLPVEKEHVMFKVVKLKSLLILLAAILVTAAIVTGVTLGVKSDRAANAFSPLPKKTVVVDAGHGGADPGVTGIRTGVKESDLNLKLSLLLSDLFTSGGYRAVRTRNGEGSTVSGDFDKSADMAARREIIRNANADAVISIHMNKYEDASRRGVQVFYSTEASAPLAEEMQKHLNQKMNVPTLGRGFDPIKGDFYIADNGDVPSVIVEFAFLSNPIDEALISDPDYRLRLAAEIQNAVASYLQSASNEASTALLEDAAS